MRLRARHVLPAVLAGVILAPGAAADDPCATSGCRADVDISGHAEPQPIYIGDHSEFKFTAKDDGPAGATNIELQAVIPSGLRILYVNTYGAPGCTPKGNFVDCQLGDFVREQEAVVRVGVCGPTAGTFISKAKVYANANDPNGGNNQVGATLGVKSRPSGNPSKPCSDTGSGGGSGGSGGGGGTTGSGGATGGSGSGGSAGSMQVPDPQRILKTGGISLTVKAAQSGTLKVHGRVSVTGGSIPLVSVTRGGVASGSKQKIFLGTTTKNLKRIRAAMSGGAKLSVAISASLGGGGLTAQTHVRR